jgi:hypothetical protein
MKKIITALLAVFFTTVLFAQEDVRLNDSVIFINNKPVALYDKQINNAAKRYSMGVYSFTDYVLMKAELLIFSAPVDELKPFYYYELTFPPTNDTISVYIEEDLSAALSKLIRDYKLISNDQLDKNGVKQLKAHYAGVPALAAKVKEMQDYLNDTRQLNQQVVRDRTKAVKITKEKKIIQDGEIIGSYVHTTTERQVTNTTLQTQFLETQSSFNKNVADGSIIYLENNYKVSSSGYSYPDRLGKGERGYKLYKASMSKDIVPGSIEELMLIRICILIEDFCL